MKHAVRKAVFRTDASVDIGGGHVMRCLALAHELAERGWQCTFAGTAETPKVVSALATSGLQFVEAAIDTPLVVIDQLVASYGSVDAIIVDHYGLEAGFETESRRLAKAVIVIDDLADRHHDCDLLVDQSLGRRAEDYRPLVPAVASLLIGPTYALLRSEFARLRPAALARRSKADSRPCRILVTFGATDAHDLTSRALRALEAFDPTDVLIDVMLSSQAPHLDSVRAVIAGRRNVTLHVDSQEVAKLMADADFALGAGGGTTWERCAVGLPALVVTTAENQEAQTRSVEQCGAAIVLGSHDKVTEDAIRRAIARLLDEPLIRNKMAERAASLCDGRGVQWVVEAAEQLLPAE